MRFIEYKENKELNPQKIGPIKTLDKTMKNRENKMFEQQKIGQQLNESRKNSPRN